MSTVVTPALPFSEAAAALAERVGPAVVVVNVRGGGGGAGVVWRPDGTIVTNRHVVRDERAEIVLRDGTRHVGIVVARHPDRDLAVIKVAADGLPSAEVGDSSTVRPGQLVFALGHPVGYQHAVTAGVVVAAGQAATAAGPRTGDWLQTDVTLLPGNSGGPLVDARGRVVGISTMVQGDLSLAVPSLAVERFVEGHGRGPSRAYLGFGGKAVPLRRDDHPVGFLVTEITEGAPADRAGLILGDVLVRFGDHPIVDQESLPAALLRIEPGDAVELGVLRGGEPRRFTVVATERP